MRTKTKKQLREEIATLRECLYEAFLSIPPGEVKDKIEGTYPNIFTSAVLHKYISKQSFRNSFLDLISRPPSVTMTGESNEFIYKMNTLQED